MRVQNVLASKNHRPKNFCISTSVISTVDISMHIVKNKLQTLPEFARVHARQQHEVEAAMLTANETMVHIARIDLINAIVLCAYSRKFGKCLHQYALRLFFKIRISMEVKFCRCTFRAEILLHGSHSSQFFLIMR